MSTVNNEYLLKICAIGSKSADKTALIRRYTENKFDTNYLPTLGVDISTKRIEIDNNPVKLIVVDTAGQEFFGKLRPSYYRGASACTIIFNQNDRNSFDDVLNWWKEFNKYISANVPLALIGLTSDSKEVSSKEGECLADFLNCGYFECSLENGPKLAVVFEYLARQVIEEPEMEKDGRSYELQPTLNKDIQIVRCLLLVGVQQFKKRSFTREEVLDLWIQREQQLGNQKANHILRNYLLRPRLSSVIKSLQKMPESDLRITFHRYKRGRPKTLLVIDN